MKMNAVLSFNLKLIVSVGWNHDNHIMDQSIQKQELMVYRTQDVGIKMKKYCVPEHASGFKSIDLGGKVCINATVY